MTSQEFQAAFETLTGHPPFPWQTALYEQFVSDRMDNIPAVASIPTGLGKTSIIAIWLLALIHLPQRMPRRLVYVVNRRTVVDQTTNEVERLRKNLTKVTTKFETLAISTLRGQFADNREWSADPSRPAVICGTVDMIGSRLLFSGYGVGFRAKPLHAGFLGQDALLVHDEAHLEPAFQRLIEKIQDEQNRCNEFGKFRVIELTATTRSENGGNTTAFTLTPEDREPSIVKQRIEAKKQLHLTPVEDDKQSASKIAQIAAGHKDAKSTVLVFVRTLEAVTTVEKELKKTGRPVVLLTGTMRGKERDELVETPEFKRFLKDAEQGETVYLVCTSAGEVGIDISADHMVCDLSTFESMAQRLGRVNRYGEPIEHVARIDVVHPTKFDEKDKLTAAREATLGLLHRLNGDASPKALGDLMESLTYKERRSAFAPEPTFVTATDILFDAWALTSIRDKMPGRPEVAPYLHGIADELPQTTIAWRAELDLLNDDPDPRQKLHAIFTKHRIRPHETVTINSYRVVEFLKAITKKREVLKDTRVAILFARQLTLTTIGKLIDNPGPLNADPTLVLPASFGHLNDKGMLSVEAVPPEPSADNAPPMLDIADHEGYEPTRDSATTRLRALIERTDEGWKALPLLGGKALPESVEPIYETSTALIKALEHKKTGLRVRLVQPIARDEEDRAVKSLVALTPVRQQQQAEEQSLADHVQAVKAAAEAIADRLDLPEPFRSALLFAAKWHDEGKKAAIWQRYIGGKDGQAPLGKSAKWRDPKKLSGYRHEFGSLLRIADDEARRFFADPQWNLTAKQQEEAYDLALHMIAAHHGHARPHFSHTFDRDFNTSKSDHTHTNAVRRFARLQREYGRWGLAYLESLLRAADWAASAGLETDDDTVELNGGDA